MGEVQKGQNGVRDLDIELEMRSKCRGHETSIGYVSGNSQCGI